MLYEDKQYKISRDRLKELLKIENEYYKKDPNNMLYEKLYGKDESEFFDIEKELLEYEELPSNNLKVVKITKL